MKKHLIPFTLTLLLIFSMLAGCTAARTLNAAEDRIENKIDAIEDSMEHNAEQSIASLVTPAPNTAVYSSPTPNQLTQAEAMEIALAHAGFTAEQVQYLFTEYEIDDRIPQYDVSFHVDRLEYEYEIHAETGEILSFERDD